MSARPQTYTENEPMSTATAIPTPDLTAMTLPDLHAHITHLEQTRERLTADLPELERAVIERTDACKALDYYHTVKLLERIDYEISDAQAEVEFREREQRNSPHAFFDMALAMSRGMREVRTYWPTLAGRI